MGSMVEFSIATKERFELINVDKEVEDFVARAGLKDGLVHIFVPHSTCGLILNEDEAQLKQDYLRVFKFIEQLGPFAHDQIDKNGSAHLLSTLFGQSLTMPIVNGKLAKGTWQQIMLAEFDGPRKRRVVFTPVSLVR